MYIRPGKSQVLKNTGMIHCQIFLFPDMQFKDTFLDYIMDLLNAEADHPNFLLLVLWFQNRNY
jgi:hypothetical protein